MVHSVLDWRCTVLVKICSLLHFAYFFLFSFFSSFHLFFHSVFLFLFRFYHTTLFISLLFLFIFFFFVFLSFFNLLCELTFRPKDTNMGHAVRNELRLLAITSRWGVYFIYLFQFTPSYLHSFFSSWFLPLFHSFFSCFLFI